MNSVDWNPVNLVARILVELLFTADDLSQSTVDMIDIVSPHSSRSGDTFELMTNHSNHLFHIYPHKILSLISHRMSSHP